jgi:hexosaminidase
MRKLFAAVVLSLLTVTAFADGTNGLALIPLPQKVQRLDGTFTLTPQTRIYADHASRKTAEFLAQRLRQSTGYPLKVHRKISSGALPPNAIFFTTRNADTNLGAEGYELTVATNGVVIRAPTQTGVFYGGETLLQLLPPEIFSTNLVTANWSAPCVQIEDWPRFPWRGLMLDVSRHFYNKDEVETVLDEMALYKLNHFHWHLVDDDGWRLEVKQYPKLTQTGAWRNHVDLARNHPGATRKGGENANPAWTKPAANKFSPDGQYGGFYTPEDIKEVVAYAAARHIMVVPEIEMPGHSGAVLASYPELGVSGKPYEIERPGPFHVGVLDPSNPDTYTFLETVLDEVFKLFPAAYVHIGGDEVPKGAFLKSPGCVALMEKEGFTNEFQLQSYLNKRIEKYLNAHGKTLIGWSEILKGGLSPNAVVMDWIGGGKKAAEAGHDAVMSPADPTDYCYFDHYQSTNNYLTEPRGIGGYLPLSRVYSFKPVPDDLSPELQSHILGPQGNLWTEYVASLAHVQYMIFPRAIAMAEVGWSAKDARNWDDFCQRLGVDEKRLNELDVNYRPGGNEPASESSQHTARVTTDFIDANISLDYPGFEGLSLDSLGKESFPLVTMNAPAKPWQPTHATVHGSRIEYRQGSDDSMPPRWAIEVKTNEIWLESHWSANDPPEPLVLDADTSVSHVTLLGLMETNGDIQLPCLMHFADQGTFRVTTDSGGAEILGYSAPTRKAVNITFPAATQEHPVQTYRLETVAIHPQITGITDDPRFDSFRRDWLDIFQLSPHWHCLANNASSDTCGFCYYEYADIADQTPSLTGNLTALDIVRETLDRIMAGGKAYGMPGYGRNPFYAADTLPSFLIAAEDYVQGSKDQNWLTANYASIKSWADQMLATDTNGDGLIKFPLSANSGSWPPKIKYRPSNWWDTIGFGYEDAYANALAYRALLGMTQLAQQSNHPDDESHYHAAADKLKDAYFKTFYNPQTGVLAGWRSADGQLHDYYFLWINGIAIHYGLVPADKANDIMDRLLAKMNEVGYTNFELGLPGNLVSVARKDYVDLHVRFGGGTKEDNSDGFQIYENGGANACFAYFTLAALYDLGRINDGDRMLFPLLDAFNKGDFQGHGSNGMSKDWKMWDSTCKGYEGLLTDNYYAMLAVTDREAALAKTSNRSAAQ